MRLRTLQTGSHIKMSAAHSCFPGSGHQSSDPCPSSCNYNCSPSPHPASSPALCPLFCGSFPLPPSWRVCLGQASGPVVLWCSVDALRGEEPIAGKVQSVLGEWTWCLLVLAWENEPVHWEAEQLFCFVE